MPLPRPPLLCANRRSWPALQSVSAAWSLARTRLPWGVAACSSAARAQCTGARLTPHLLTQSPNYCVLLLADNDLFNVSYTH